MSFNPLSPAGAAPSPADDHLLRTLMGRLHLNSNSNPLHDLLLLPNALDHDDHDDDDDENGVDGDGSDSKRRRRLIAKEESKLEKEIVRIVLAGDAVEALKANSGQSVAIGDHNICVGVHQDQGSEYRVWEWHGHIMFFDDEDGYSAEYIYGNYFEKLSKPSSEAKGKKKNVVVDDEEEDEEVGDGEVRSKVQDGRSSGLKDLIKELEGSEVSRRVVRRNSSVVVGAATR